MKSSRLKEMKQKNFILERKIKKNWDEIRLLIKIFEKTEAKSESKDLPEEIKIAKDLLEKMEEKQME